MLWLMTSRNLGADVITVHAKVNENGFMGFQGSKKPITYLPWAQLLINADM